LTINKETIGIIGYGVVGKAAEATFSKEYDVRKYDKYISHDSFESLLLADYILISVPTPFDYKTNRLNDSAILESLESLQKMNYDKAVIIKSTLTPGRCDNYSDLFNLKIVYNPEFLRESKTPFEDFARQDTIVIGTKENNSNLSQLIEAMYRKVCISNAKYYHLSYLEAEMVKSAQNTMLSSRVALSNIIFDACENLGIDYDKIREIAFDRFEILGPHMVKVPGPDGKRGFGGKCLPKDISAFSSIYNSEIITNIIEYNKSLRDDL